MTPPLGSDQLDPWLKLLTLWLTTQFVQKWEDEFQLFNMFLVQNVIAVYRIHNEFERIAYTECPTDMLTTSD